ncbi:ANTAR domain-containing protein [Nocardioides sp. MAHUQ-72]|uniref:ANTAR domain-containing protein n=1 Tax=unclassified Nocardioides TaxID=2615069 RepID=UPI00360D46BC
MSRRSRVLEGSRAFDALTAPAVLLDTDYVIRATNPAYLRVTDRSEEELVSINLFEAFPDNPEAGGQPVLAASFERVLQTRRPLHLGVLRYDLLEQEPPRYRTRHWVPVGAPVHDGDDVVGILLRVDDVTGLRPSALRALEARGAAIARHQGEDEANEEVVRSLVIAAGDLEAMAEEIEQLREALSSRATIDQAKGIVMAQVGCSADEAWRRLVKMSNDTNVRVADVAAAVVYRVARSGEESVSGKS